MNHSSYKYIIASCCITVYIYVFAAILIYYAAKPKEPAFRIVAHEYKAESLIADQMRRLRENGSKPVPYEQEIISGYKIKFQPGRGEGDTYKNKWFYRLILTNPQEKRVLQIIASPETPDVFTFE